MLNRRSIFDTWQKAGIGEAMTGFKYPFTALLDMLPPLIPPSTEDARQDRAILQRWIEKSEDRVSAAAMVLALVLIESGRCGACDKYHPELPEQSYNRAGTLVNELIKAVNDEVRAASLQETFDRMVVEALARAAPQVHPLSPQPPPSSEATEGTRSDPDGPLDGWVPPSEPAPDDAPQRDDGPAREGPQPL